MQKRLKAGLLLLSLALTLTSCAQNQAYVNSENGVSNAETASNEIIVDNKTESKAYEILGESKEIEVEYPVVSGMADSFVQEQVNKTIFQAFESEYNLLYTEANVVSTAYEVTYQSNEWISIKFNYSINLEGQGDTPYELFTTFTVNMRTGEPILFNNIWNGLDAQAYNEFVEYVNSQLEDGIENPLNLDNMYPEAYITDSRLILYYYDVEMHKIELPLEASMLKLMGANEVE